MLALFLSRLPEATKTWAAGSGSWRQRGGPGAFAVVVGGVEGFWVLQGCFVGGVTRGSGVSFLGVTASGVSGCCSHMAALPLLQWERLKSAELTQSHELAIAVVALHWWPHRKNQHLQ